MPRFQTILNRHRLKHLFQAKRQPKKLCKISGFIVAATDSLILLQRFDWDLFCLNGYSVIRDVDVKSYRFFATRKYWQFRAIKLRKLKPVPPTKISLISLPELLVSISKNYPLLTIHREKINPDVCYIGKLSKMTDQSFTIEDLNNACDWTGSRRMKFEDVTRIDFGGGYENALEVTAPKLSKNKIYGAT